MVSRYQYKKEIPFDPNRYVPLIPLDESPPDPAVTSPFNCFAP